MFGRRLGCKLLLGGTSVAIGAIALGTQSPVQAKEENIFIINGFYMAMREKYTKPGTSIYYYLLEWDPEKLSWNDFRNQVLGATDPATAVDGSLRKTIFSDWKALGLAAEPNVGDNGVHASASPFEALAERLNWMGADVETDAFGKAMLAAGIPKETIMLWTKDPQVMFEGKKQSLFDILEDTDVDECLAKSQAVAGVKAPRPSGKMQAFVFLKPHAVTDSSKALLVKTFNEVGLKVQQEGSLGAETIENNKLIDNHYYAIANKASLSKPAELNPPVNKQKEFAVKFGISWEQALADGLVYNAVDGCRKLGIDGRTMDERWAAAKKEGNLVKFGGGFYAGKIPKPSAQEPNMGWLSATVLSLAALVLWR